MRLLQLVQHSSFVSVIFAVLVKLLFDVSGFCATIQLERQVRFQVQLVLLLRIIARPHLK